MGFILAVIGGLIIPFVIYKLAVRKWSIEGTREKIILTIVIWISCIVPANLFEYFLTISYYANLGETVTWIFSGCAYIFTYWKVVSFLAVKILKVHEKKISSKTINTSKE